MLMNILQIYLLNWQGVGPLWVICIPFAYTELPVWAFPQSHRINLTYCLKFSLLLTFRLLLVCMIDQTQTFPSSILPLGLFQGIIYNIERLKGGTLESWITGWSWFERGNLIPLFPPWNVSSVWSLHDSNNECYSFNDS